MGKVSGRDVAKLGVHEKKERAKLNYVSFQCVADGAN